MAETPVSKPLVLVSGISLALVLLTTAWFGFAQARVVQAPDVSLQLIDGRTIDLHKLHGKPVLLSFWATTCAICVKKTPELKALYQRFEPKGLELIAVAMAYDPPNRILAFSENNNIPYPIALDLDGSVAMAFNDVRLTPTTVLIAADGNIVMTRTGDFDTRELEEKILKLLVKDKPRALAADLLTPVTST